MAARSVGLLRRIATESISQSPVLTVKSVISGLMGIFFQGAGVAAAAFLMSSIVGRTEGMEKIAQFFDGSAGIAFVSLAGCLFFWLGGALVVYTQRLNLEICKAYQIFCTNRGLSRFGLSEGTVERSQTKPSGGKNSGTRSVINGARGCFVTLQDLLGSWLAIVYVVLSSAVLFYLNWQLTLLILLAGSLIAASTALRGVEGMRRYRVHQHQSAKSNRQLKRLIDGRLNVDQDAENHSLSSSQDVPVRHMDTYIDRIMTRERSKFMNSVLATGAFFLVLALGGAGIVGAVMTTVQMVAYIMLLRFSVMSVRRLGDICVGLFARLKVVIDYFDFIDQVDVPRTVVTL